MESLSQDLILQILSYNNYISNLLQYRLIDRYFNNLINNLLNNIKNVIIFPSKNILCNMDFKFNNHLKKISTQLKENIYLISSIQELQFINNSSLVFLDLKYNLLTSKNDYLFYEYDLKQYTNLLHLNIKNQVLCFNIPSELIKLEYLNISDTRILSIDYHYPNLKTLIYNKSLENIYEYDSLSDYDDNDNNDDNVIINTNDNFLNKYILSIDNRILDNLQILKLRQILNINFYNYNSTYLLELNISYCIIDKLPNSLVNLIKLECQMTTNLRYIPNTFTKLIYLNCANTEIQKLPEQLINLQFLDCSFTCIQLLSSNFNKLKYLNCSHTYINTIPIKYTMLTFLDINNTYNIMKLNKYLISLKHLYCYNSNIKYISNTFINLEILDISYTKIKQIPYTLTKLNKIKCNNSNIKYIPRTMINLSYINCSNTRIRYLPKKIKYINQLIIHHSNIIYIPYKLKINNLICDYKNISRNTKYSLQNINYIDIIY